MSDYSQIIFIVKNQPFPTDLGENLCSIADNTICRNGWTLWELKSIAWDDEDPFVRKLEKWMEEQDDTTIYTFQQLDENSSWFSEHGDAVYVEGCPFAIERISYLKYNVE